MKKKKKKNNIKNIDIIIAFYYLWTEPRSPFPSLPAFVLVNLLLALASYLAYTHNSGNNFSLTSQLKVKFVYFPKSQAIYWGILLRNMFHLTNVFCLLHQSAEFDTGSIHLLEGELLSVLILKLNWRRVSVRQNWSRSESQFHFKFLPLPQFSSSLLDLLKISLDLQVPTVPMFCWKYLNPSAIIRQVNAQLLNLSMRGEMPAGIIKIASV